MNSTQKKMGRPTAFHRMSNGDKIDGMSRLADGRWKISPFPGQPTAIKFSEADEWLALSKFNDIKASVNASPKVLVDVGKFADPANAMKAAKKAVGGQAYVFRVAADGSGVSAAVTKNFDTPEYWAWLRTQLIKRADWVSERCGIDLTNLKPPAPSVKLSALIDAYTSKPKLSPNEAGRSKLFWTEFTKAVGVTNVSEIGHPQIIKYEKAVLSTGLAAKSIHHRFAKVKTIVAYGLKRGMDIEGCRSALDAMAMLEVKNAHAIDPQPIPVDDFWSIHGKATKAGDETFATLILMALNCCCYGGEVAAIRWSELDLKAGTYVGRRPKTGVSRVATLWPEVVTTLKKIPKRDGVDYIFNTTVRSYTTFSVLAAWRKYREAAGFGDDMTFGRIRDASYSIACQSGSLDMAKVLAGHRFSGASDFYVRRNPAFVTDACQAIHKAFLVAKKVKAA